MKHSQRYKKHGWYGESYRHYLASKGVSTGRKGSIRYMKNKYFSKGRRMTSLEAAATSLGFDEPQLSEAIFRQIAETKARKNPNSAWAEPMFREMEIRKSVESVERQRNRDIPYPTSISKKDQGIREPTYTQFTALPEEEIPFEEVPINVPAVTRPAIEEFRGNETADFTESSVDSDQYPVSADLSGQMTMTPAVPERSSLEFEL